MGRSVLTVLWLFSISIWPATTNNSKLTHHINFAEVILFHCKVCGIFTVHKGLLQAVVYSKNLSSTYGQKSTTEYKILKVQCQSPLYLHSSSYNGKRLLSLKSQLTKNLKSKFRSPEYSKYSSSTKRNDYLKLVNYR